MDVLEGLVEPGQEGRNAHGHQQGNDTGPPAHLDQFPLAGVAAEIGVVEIHRENGGDAVHHRCQGTDDGSGEGCKGNALDAGGQQVAQQPRVGFIRFLQRGTEGVGGNAGYHDQDGDDEFDEPRKQHTVLCLPDRLGGQCPLDDVLVASPVVEVGDP